MTSKRKADVFDIGTNKDTFHRLTGARIAGEAMEADYLHRAHVLYDAAEGLSHKRSRLQLQFMAAAFEDAAAIAHAHAAQAEEMQQ